MQGKLRVEVKKNAGSPSQLDAVSVKNITFERTLSTAKEQLERKAKEAEALKGLLNGVDNNGPREETASGTTEAKSEGSPGSRRRPTVPPRSTEREHSRSP